MPIFAIMHEGSARVKTQTGSSGSTADPATSGPVHYVYDLTGNLIAETDGNTGQTLREYIWLSDSNRRASPQASLPLALITDVDTAPATYYVVADHLNRPTELFDSIKSQVWQAIYLPYGATHSITGSLNQNLRFPGQFFQIESGLHYNWHRSYDPSLGRYTQGDPLGFVDGPSLYAYVKNNPVMYTDPDGRFACGGLCIVAVGAAIGAGLDFASQYYSNDGNLSCISGAQVAYSAAFGAIGGGGAGLLARFGTRFLARGAAARNGLTTPSKYFGNKTYRQAAKGLKNKFGPARGGGKYNRSFYNEKTGRTYNLHKDPSHRGGRPHVDIRKRGLSTQHYKNRPFFLK